MLRQVKAIDRISSAGARHFLMIANVVRASKDLRNFAIYALSSVLNSAIPFLLLPMLTAHLSTAEFGQLSLIQVSVSFATPVVLCGAADAVILNFRRLTRENFGRYLSSAFLIPFFVAVVAACVLWFARAEVEAVSGFPFRWLLLIPLLALSQFPLRALLALLQFSERPLKYGALQIGFTGLNIGLSVLLVVAFGFGWEGRMSGILSAQLVFAGISIVILVVDGYFREPPKFSYVKDAISLGVPMIPHSLGAIAMSMSDRFFISKLIGIGAVGEYAVGAQIAGLMSMAMLCLNQVWAPKVFNTLGSEAADAKKTLVRQTYLMAVLIGVAFIGVWVISPFLFSHFIDPKYSPSRRFVPWLALSAAFQGLYFLVTNYIFYAKRTKVLALITFSHGILNAILNISLIPWLGAMGAAVASALTWCSFFLVSWAASARIYPMPWGLVFRTWRHRE